MFEFGIGSIVAVFEILGAIIIFVIIWILKSEKRREIYKTEMVKLSRQVESQEREKSILLDRLEDSESLAQELETAEPSRLKDLKNENRKLYEELAEAKESLEEVFKAVHEET